MSIQATVWKVVLFLRIWSLTVAASALLRRHVLAEVVERFSRPVEVNHVVPPVRLSRAVDRSLRVGPWQPRCLVRSLVLYRLLAGQGDRADLVIGLPEDPKDHTAHAWVEIDGRDVGPSPGRVGHAELARYPLRGRP